MAGVVVITAGVPLTVPCADVCRVTIRSLKSLTSAALFLGSLNACRDVAPAFGPTIPAARANAEALFGGIATRFANVQRDPKFLVARRKLGHSALTPSVIYNDTSVWTAWGTDSTRTLTLDGEFSNNRYLFSARPWPSKPAGEPGDSRHSIRLRKITDDQYEWVTTVDINSGPISPNDFANVISRLMRSAEGRSVQEIRADYRSSYARTTSSLGRIFSLDTLSASRDVEGATTVRLGVRINPNGVRSTLPAFADYLDKYVTPSKYRALVTDKRGGRWIELNGDENLMTIRLRTLNGHFAPLNGPVRPIPDELQLTSDFTTKILFFTVGFRAMIADMTVIRSQRERGWLLKFTREPDWRLPPTVGFMIRTPLKRPFQGSGSAFRVVLRDIPGTGTFLSRYTSTIVQESAILRFLGRLGATAMGDFVGKAETEENRFSADVFNSLRLDTRALLP